MAMVWTLGYMLNRRKLAVAIFSTMLAIYLPMVVFAVAQEMGGNHAIAAMGGWVPDSTADSTSSSRSASRS